MTDRHLEVLRRIRFAAPLVDAPRVDSSAWLAWFRHNRSRESASVPTSIAVHPELHDALVHALQVFHLGEAGEGRVAKETACSDDPVLDAALVECVELYVREEGRHARELLAVLRGLGADPLRRTPAEKLFRWTRRAIGLRQKMLTIVVAEIVGLVFYELLNERVPHAAIADTAARIAADENAHLDFQAALFRSILAHPSVPFPRAYAAAVAFVFAAVLTGAVATVAIDQRRLLRALGCSPVELARRCVAEVAARFPLDDRGATYAERVRVESSLEVAASELTFLEPAARPSDPTSRERRRQATEPNETRNGASDEACAARDAARITRPRRAA
jgi:hypothetical protein